MSQSLLFWLIVNTSAPSISPKQRRTLSFCCFFHTCMHGLFRACFIMETCSSGISTMPRILPTISEIEIFQVYLSKLTFRGINQATLLGANRSSLCDLSGWQTLLFSPLYQHDFQTLGCSLSLSALCFVSLINDILISV